MTCTTLHITEYLCDVPCSRSKWVRWTLQVIKLRRVNSSDIKMNERKHVPLHGIFWRLTRYNLKPLVVLWFRPAMKKTSFYAVIQVYVQSNFKRRLLIFLVTVLHSRDRSLRTRSYIGLSWEKWVETVNKALLSSLDLELVVCAFH